MTIKPLIAGLLHRQGPLAPSAFRKVVNAGIITVNWADLQATSGGPLNTSMIDQQLDQAKTYAQRVKIKVFAGQHAPVWAKNLDGPPVRLFDPPSTRFFYAMPRWWTSNFLAAYRDLLGKLAGRYEADPAVTTLQASMCGTFFAEPFLRQAILSQNRSRLLAAGFSVELDDVAIRAMIVAHAELLPTTRMDLACHPYQRIDSDGSYGGQDQAYTRGIMEFARATMGPRACFGYTAHGKDPEPGSAEAQLYEDLAAVGHPIWLQTATLEKLGGRCPDLCAALADAVRRGAYEVELPAGYQQECTPTSLASFDTTLSTQAATG